MMSFVIVLALPIVAIIFFVASTRRTRRAQLHQVFAHDVDIAPLVSRTGGTRIAIETRPPLRRASMLDEGGEAVWKLSSLAPAAAGQRLGAAPMNADALRALLPAVAGNFVDGGDTSMWVEPGAVHARIRGWKPRSPDALKQRFLAFVDVVDALEFGAPRRIAATARPSGEPLDIDAALANATNDQLERIASGEAPEVVLRRG